MTSISNKLSDLFKREELVKATLSKPRSKTDSLLNIYVLPIVLKGEVQYQLTYRHKTKDQVKNLDAINLPLTVEQLMTDVFFNLDIVTDHYHHTLLQNKKGRQTWLKKKVETATVSRNLQHDRTKVRSITEDRPFLKLLGLSSSEGKVYRKAQNKYKQINRYVELIHHLIKDDEHTRLRIADMGSGKGYLTFALYDYLHSRGIKAEVTGIEMRTDLVQLCSNIAEQVDMHGLRFKEGNIADIELPQLDMVIALHACDIATDMAIANAIKAKAQYIILAPCCQKQIRREIGKSSLLEPVLKHGIFEERMAEMLTDGIRCLIMESLGYKTKAFEFISAEHTNKNVMIMATYTGHKRKEALEEIEQLKEHFGIGYHHLEKII